MKRILIQGVLIFLVVPALLPRIGEWTRGIDSQFIVYGQTTPPAPAASTGVTRIIPQIAVGSFDGNATRYKTVIQVVNEGASGATVSGDFFNEDGSASRLVLKTNLSTLPTTPGSFASINLPANSVLIITADTAPAFTVNWAKIVSTGGTVSVSAYFDLTAGAGASLYSRVGVPASDAAMNKFTIPRARNADSGLDVGFALVNTGTAPATIDATLRSATGSALATRSLTLDAGTHTAAFAKDFFRLNREETGTSYSFMVFESRAAQFAATALAIEGGSLSSFPVSTPGSVGTAPAGELVDGSVTSVKLASSAVITDKIADNAITAGKVATGQVVKSINSLKDNVTLAAGTNVTITPSGSTLTISASGTTGQTGSANANVIVDSATPFKTAVGSGALINNTNDGAYNTASGYQALQSNTDGSSNTAGGYQALQKNTQGGYNTASGFQALQKNTFGGYNTASGSQALANNTSGTYNTATGALALSANTSGSSSTAAGYGALENNSEGARNTASGYQTLQSNTTTSDNTAVGYQALQKNTVDGSTAVGSQALSSSTTGVYNTAIGYQALQSSTEGAGNTAVGYQALQKSTQAGDNTAVGYLAMQKATGGSNVAVGSAALLLNTTGSSNTATGASALRSNTTGSGNTANGKGTLYRNTTGSSNTAGGENALFENQTGTLNAAYGKDALYNNINGGNNTGSGYHALYANTTGTFNTAIGSSADVASGNLTNATAVGANAKVNASNKIRLGDSAVTVIEGAVAYTFTSDRTKKENFRPVDAQDVLRKISNLEVTSWNYIGNDPRQFRHYGPMAQDFFAAFGHDGAGTIGTPTTLSSGDIEGILMLALQALQKKTEDLQNENEKLKARLDALEQSGIQIGRVR